VELALHEMTSVEQIAALKEGRIDVGFGRIPPDDPTLQRQLLRNEKLPAGVPGNHRVLAGGEALRLEDLAGKPLIVYPKASRPSYADQVLSLFREAGLKPPAVHRGAGVADRTGTGRGRGRRLSRPRLGRAVAP